MKSKLGLIHIYTGAGKGKTTASVGLCVRAAGCRLRVAFIQFLKGQDTGEIHALKRLGVTVIRSEDVKKFIPAMTQAERELCRKGQEACLDKAREALSGGEYDLVVLDEIIPAAATGMIKTQDIMDMIKGKHAQTEVVLTGRDPDPQLIAAADYVSEIGAVKHPFENGVSARRGIEY